MNAKSINRANHDNDWIAISCFAVLLLCIAIMCLTFICYLGFFLLQITTTRQDKTQPTSIVAQETDDSMPQTVQTVDPNKLDVFDTVVSDIDGMVMVYIPAGEFLMGRKEPYSSEYPRHAVYLNAFWIDQTEVTNEMFSKFILDTGYKTDAEIAGSSKVYRNYTWPTVNGADWEYPNGPDSDILDRLAHPVVHISWNDANAYCEWAGRRLPTEAEWEKAASWDANAGVQRVYPWGNSIDGNYANYKDYSNFDEYIADTTPVGSYDLGISFYGSYDMLTEE